MGLSKEQEDLYKKTMAEVKHQLEHLDEEVEKELQKVRKRLAELQESKKSLKMVYEGTAKLLGIELESEEESGDETASIAGRGWDNLRFHRPGVAGDELRARVTHVERGPGSRPERGVLVSRFELLNQRDERVISFDAHVVMLRREPLAA